MPLRICTLNLTECASHPQNFWKYFNSVSEEPVTRSDFMSVLSNIEYILIKASYGQGLQQSRYLETSRRFQIFSLFESKLKGFDSLYPLYLLSLISYIFLSLTQTLLNVNIIMKYVKSDIDYPSPVLMWI